MRGGRENMIQAKRVHGRRSEGEKELRDTQHKIQCSGNFPGGPVGKTSPSNAGGGGSISGQNLRSHMPLSQKPKHKKQKQYCHKFNKDLKIGPHQKHLRNKETHTPTHTKPEQYTVSIQASFPGPVSSVLSSCWGKKHGIHFTL